MLCYKSVAQKRPQAIVKLSCVCMQVQHARGIHACMQGAPKFDFLKLKEVAAHEKLWTELFAPIRIFE